MWKINCNSVKKYWEIKAIIFASVALWIGWLLVAVLQLGWPTTDNLGIYGDTFGALNALFSGAALIGLGVAIIYEKKAFHAGTLDRDLESLRNRRENTLIASVVDKKWYNGQPSDTASLTLQNLGKTVFRASVSVSLDQKVSLEIRCPIAIPPDTKFEIIIKNNDEGVPLTLLPLSTVDFSLTYLDLDGTPRIQIYSVKFEAEIVAVCSSLGLTRIAETTYSDD